MRSCMLKQANSTQLVRWAVTTTKHLVKVIEAHLTGVELTCFKQLPLRTIFFILFFTNNKVFYLKK